MALDRAHVWHPYSSMPPGSPALLVEAASGIRLRIRESDTSTRDVIDAMSSWWAAIHGYRHPTLDAAVHQQIGRMSHVMFGGLTHEPAIRLAKTLVDITPASLEHVFFSDSGSVAVEVAMKMCLQYWHAQGRSEKHRVMTWRGGYHGDTFHPMSVCDPEGGMHHLWTGVLPRQVFADAPPAGFDAPLSSAYVAQLSQLIRTHANELAAIIVEPVVQGAGGMCFHNPEYLTVLRELATRHDVLLIVDEIATGFGRTGQLFAGNHVDLQPDVMAVGKALTGGYLSMAATLCSARVANGISGAVVPVLAHGPTFMGNPLAASVANASIGVLHAGDWQLDIERIGTGLQSGLDPARSIAGVADVRTLGAIGVIQLDHQVDVRRATEAALAQGVWIRPFRDLIYAMPPYITDDNDLAAITNAMCAAAAVA